MNEQFNLFAQLKFCDWKVKKYEQHNSTRKHHKHKCCWCDDNWSWSFKKIMFRSWTEDECDDLMKTKNEFNAVKIAIKKCESDARRLTRACSHDDWRCENSRWRTTHSLSWWNRSSDFFRDLNIAMWITLFASDLHTKMKNKTAIEYHANADKTSWTVNDLLLNTTTKTRRFLKVKSEEEPCLKKEYQFMKYRTLKKSSNKLLETLLRTREMNHSNRLLLQKQCERVWKSMKKYEIFTQKNTMNCTIKNAALFLQVSERTIRNYIDDWMLEVIRIQRPWKQQCSVRITSDSLNALVEHSTIKKEHLEQEALES